MPNLLSPVTAMLFTLGVIHATETGAVPAKPNIVLVFADQLRQCSLGFVGEEPVQTPNLDRLARAGVVFTNAVSNFPVCSPFRALMLSGLYPHRTGVKSNMNSYTAPMELPTDTVCWSDVLAKNGYDLAYIGKWHLDAPHAPYVKTANNNGEIKWNEWTPPERRHGFSHWIAYGTYDHHLRPMYWQTAAGRDDWQFVDEWGPTYEATRAIEYIENTAGKLRAHHKPFALVVSMNPPHHPYHQVPTKYREKYQNLTDEQILVRDNILPASEKWGKLYRQNIRDYYAGITGVDAEFGRIMDALHAQGLDENTLVIFTSDHGDCLGVHREATKNNFYEEAVNIPLIVRYPARIKHAFTTDYLASVADLYPTIMEFTAAGDVPEKLDGESLVTLLVTGATTVEPPAQLIRRYGKESRSNEMIGVRDKRYTYAQETDKNTGELTEFLFDRTMDKYQMNNLADKPAATEILNTMKQKLTHLREKTGE